MGDFLEALLHDARFTEHERCGFLTFAWGRVTRESLRGLYVASEFTVEADKPTAGPEHGHDMQHTPSLAGTRRSDRQ
jgi:hypothetical protein